MKPVRAKLAVFSMMILFSIALAGATDLNNIESITPAGSNPINITGELNMEGNPISNYFGNSCNSGEVVVHINDDGTLDCVDATSEVQNDFVDRSGDTMSGTLDMQGNSIINADWSDANDLNSGGGISDFSNANDLDSGGNIVDFSAANDLDTSGNIADFSAASDLNSGGGISDFSNAGDLNSGGGISDFSNANDLDGNGNVNHGLSATLNDGNSANQNIDMNGNQIRSIGSAWIDNNELGTYEWSEGPSGQKADLKTRSIEIVDDNSDDSGTDPWLALHDYGGGGPRIRFSQEERTLYVEEQQGRDNYDKVKIEGGNLDMNGNRVTGIGGIDNSEDTRTDIFDIKGSEAGDDTVDYHVEVARISTTNYDGSGSGSAWNFMGPVEFDIRERYYGSGGKIEAVVSAGRYGDRILEVKEASGKYVPNIYLGDAVDTGTDSNGRSVYYIPVYVELDNYRQLVVETQHNGDVVDSGTIDESGEISYPLNYNQQSASQFSGGIDINGVDSNGDIEMGGKSIRNARIEGTESMQLPVGTDAY